MSTKLFQFLITGSYDAEKPIDKESFLGPMRNVMMLWAEPRNLMYYGQNGIAHPAYYALRDVWMEMSEDERAGLPGRLRDSLAVLFVRPDADPVDDSTPSTH